MKMMRARTFGEVLYNLDDQVIVRKLLLKHVPSNVRQTIVDEFNEHVEKYNANEKDDYPPPGYLGNINGLGTDPDTP